MILEKFANNILVSKFYEVLFKIRLPNKTTDLGKIKIINKLLAKEYYNEYKSILTDFYMVYLSIKQSCSELEDLFSNIIKIAKSVTKVKLNLIMCRILMIYKICM